MADFVAKVGCLGWMLVSGSAEGGGVAEMDRLKVGGSMVGIDPLFGFGRQPKWVQLACRYRIPTIYGARFDPVAGGLVSYGPNLGDTWRQAGISARHICGFAV
jgi:hypothetical protein